MQLIPVVLCGGSGSRLWPVSREQHPKPFIRLKDGQSLLQKAFLLGASLPAIQEVYSVTNCNFVFKIKDEIAEVNQQDLDVSFIIEPVARNTAAAIASAALQIAKQHTPETLILILAADHIIDEFEIFQQAVSEGIPLAEQGKLVTFGIKPDSPNTGYGYIEAQGTNVLRFVEKPNAQTALEYLNSGQFLWNSGMFLFSAASIIAAMKTHCPEIIEQAEHCIEQSVFMKGQKISELILDSKLFSLIPNESIDYAVLEKSKQVAVVSSQIKWNDVGSWSTLEQYTPPDANGNRLEGDVLLHDVENCYVKSAERLIGAVGVKDLFIIDTPDALLVADKTRSQDIKQIYTSLEKQGHEAYRTHRMVHRPWGTYTILEEAKHFKIKRLEVKPGATLSLQMHHHRSEHWVVVSGIAKVINDDREFFVRVNESTYIKAGAKHRLENPGSLKLVMIEVQTGDYLGEDDIVRFEDVYGRV